MILKKDIQYQINVDYVIRRTNQAWIDYVFRFRDGDRYLDGNDFVDDRIWSHRWWNQYTIDSMYWYNKHNHETMLTVRYK